MKTYKFLHPSGFYLTVKEEFLEKCPEPDKETSEDLIYTYKIKKYLHSLDGPAIEGTLTDQKKEYRIDGKEMSENEWNKFVQNHKFDVKMQEVIACDQT